MHNEEGDWTSAGLFSPSKARVQQAQAKDWAVVDAWLSKIYPSLPAFERNDSTLVALLALASANDSADEQRGYLARIDKTVLSASSKKASAHDSHDKTYQLITGVAKDSADLSHLAEAAVALDCAVTDVKSMAASLLQLTSQSFMLSEQVRRIEANLDLIKLEQARLEKDVEKLDHGGFRPPMELAEKTADWLRGAKHMRGKLGEYDERLNSLDTTDSSANFDMILQQSEGLRIEAARLSRLESQLHAFQSLPTNPRAAQSKVESAREELLSLVKERDRFFEQLAETS